MKWKKINNISSFSKIIGDIDWEESFIREVSIVSPSYVKNKNIVALNSLPSARFFFIIPNHELNLEFFFVSIDKISLSFETYETLKVEDKFGKTAFTFTTDQNMSVCEDVYYRFVKEGDNPQEPKYIWEQIYDTSGMMIYKL